MDSASTEAAAWIVKAQDDLIAATLIERNRGPTTVGCYLCQQAMEKLLKALLLHHRQMPPRTHDLVELLRRLGAHSSELGLSPIDLRAWTAYATAARYPGFPDPQSDSDLPCMLSCAVELAKRTQTIIKGIA